MSNVSLFQFATSELSQDAFICWLLSCSDPQSGIDQALHQAGRDFLSSLFAVAEIEPPAELTKVEVKKQYKNIDIVVLVNDESHVLVIEDKVFTGAHSGQLERYSKIAKEVFSNSEIGFIYFKTGNQSSFEKADKANYKIYRREQFLEVLDRGIQNDVSNHIFLDYKSYLAGIEESIQAYKHKALDDWDWNCWTGFFTNLQQNYLDDAEWGHVPNAAGGFMGMWWHGRDNKYLQLEQEKLCFKIIVEDKDLQSDARNKWHAEVVQLSEQSGLNLCKPDRFGKGEFMTAAVLNDGDYRRTNADGTLDIAKTVSVLKEAERLLDNAVPITG